MRKLGPGTARLILELERQLFQDFILHSALIILHLHFSPVHPNHRHCFHGYVRNNFVICQHGYLRQRAFNHPS